MSSILRSSDLIKTIKRRAFIPESQETFEPEDFLEMATEKVNINLMDQIMTARGDYLVYSEDVPVVQGVTSYAIPDRAHGNKLREASIVDKYGKTVRELTQISLEELTDYQSDYVTYSTFDPFYVQNNMLVLLNENLQPDHFVRMYFYMRPNKLVLESRAATVSAPAASVEIDTINPKAGTITDISLTGVITSTNHGLTSGDLIAISGTDSDPSFDGNHTVTYIDQNTFSIGIVPTSAGTTGSWNLLANVYIYSSTVYPKHFTTDILYDVVSCVSPNKIKLYNLQPNSTNNTTKTLSFRVVDVGTNIVKGDYITKAEETIVPNLPTEYHPVLAQMVAVSCLEAMGDEPQKQSANKTLAEMERAVLRIVSNRVEGAPKKIKNRHGTLNQTLRNSFARRRG